PSQTWHRVRNLLTSTIDGATTAWTYDAASRPLTETSPTGAVTRYGYTGTSQNPSEITGPDGGVTRFTLANGLGTDWTDADGNTTAFSYGPNGDLASVTSPLREATDVGSDAA